MKIGLPFKKNYYFGQPFGNPAPLYTDLGLKGHNGLDFSCPTGTEIISCTDGIVEYAGSDISAGLGVYIIGQLGEKTYRWIYWHFKSFKVAVGDSVRCGQVIGISDNTGLSTGPHLHFGMKEVKKVGSIWQTVEPNNGYTGAVDPFPYLPEVLMGVTIQKGMQGGFVVLVQTYMNKLNNAHLVVDGKFGAKTEKAVKDFQSKNSLIPDGKVGSLTMNKILSLV